jgi:UDP-N-acetyl-D-mannosaminuronate dehydrogenase
MTNKEKVAVIGLGEVGKPLFDLMRQYHDTVGVDIAPPERVEAVDVLHICYPFEIADFVGETVRYIDMYSPKLTVINSTVAVGTTRRIAELSGSDVVNSPIRGKHACMLEELRLYTKFVGGITPVASEQAAKHFASVGLTTKTLATPEATELAKLTETTYFGLLIAWAQEVERYCDKTGADYAEVVSFYEEIKYLPPVKYFPGIIGGHCVMPNIKILSLMAHSDVLATIESSNVSKIERERRKASPPEHSECTEEVAV